MEMGVKEASASWRISLQAHCFGFFRFFLVAISCFAVILLISLRFLFSFLLLFSFFFHYCSISLFRTFAAFSHPSLLFLSKLEILSLILILFLQQNA
jgi:hypothetical protein